MESVNINIGNKSRKKLEKMLIKFKKTGDVRGIKRVLAILKIAEGHPVRIIASIFDVLEKTVCRWLENFILKGSEGLKSLKPPGRKPKLTKSQKRELAEIIKKGPEKAGFPGACWRSPMIQHLIHEKFGVLYAVNYISQLLRNMGFSYQKAKFTPSRKSVASRKEWLNKTWPEIGALADRKDAMILFGDEASFPQWGTLTYTWAPKGRQPLVKTSGIRKSYKVFGLIDYFSGTFFSKGHEGRLNSESHTCFLKEVMQKTDKHIILVHDGAPYHKSRAMRAFYEENAERISVYRLPAYSPDYNPIEMLWKKLKEKETHLHYFPTFDALKKKVNEALLHFENMKEDILSLFGLYGKQAPEIKIGRKVDSNV